MTLSVVIVRAAYFIAALQLFGLMVFRLVFSPREFAGPGFHRAALASAWLAILALAIWLPVEAGSMGDENIGEAIADGTLGTVLTETRFGHFWAARMLLFIGIAGILFWNGRLARVLAALLAGAALALSAASGHAGANAGWPGAAQLAGDMCHLAAAGAWIGGLVPFAWIMTRHVRAGGTASLAEAYDAAHRFSVLGIVCVATILVTGSINSWFLVGGVPALIGTDYGRLLSLKISLFAVVVGIAAINRLRLTPLVAKGAVEALAALRRNAGIEAAIGLAIVSIVGLLGTLPPAVHDEPVWPFSFKLVWTPFPTVEEAHPTSFMHSPIPMTSASILRGAALYAAHCASCHGLNGKGDGPAAASLPVKPADLTAISADAPAEGDLFWWISRGIGQAMPAFGGVLKDRQRWDLINFLRARNAGHSAWNVGSGSGWILTQLELAFETGARRQPRDTHMVLIR